ncbi:PREDICTED: uncharacterized protein LOC106149373, partial [Chinchilla lanigera]|uniref:uncharacterized protein LOC106149373 n=1 Tax=Chinchilla lanigera TaxID=34839 RepID=UPI0006982DFD
PRPAAGSRAAGAGACIPGAARITARLRAVPAPWRPRRRPRGTFSFSFARVQGGSARPGPLACTCAGPQPAGFPARPEQRAGLASRSDSGRETFRVTSHPSAARGSWERKPPVANVSTEATNVQGKSRALGRERHRGGVAASAADVADVAKSSCKKRKWTMIKRFTPRAPPTANAFFSPSYVHAPAQVGPRGSITLWVRLIWQTLLRARWTTEAQHRDDVALICSAFAVDC